MSNTAKKEEVKKDESCEDNLELTEEEMDKLVEDIEGFQDSFLKILAGTHKYEIIPSTDEAGRPLDKKHYSLLRSECSRLGLKILYKIDVGNKTVIINPRTLKIGIICEEIH